MQRRNEYKKMNKKKKNHDIDEYVSVSHNSFIDDWQEKGERKRSQTIVKIVGFVTVLLLACIITIYVNIQRINNKEQDRSLAQETPAASTDNAAKTTPSVLLNVSKPLFEALRDYDNVVGYLIMPEVTIELPIVQTDNDTYYISHSYSGKLSPSGALFLNADSKLGKTKHITIFGNNLDDGTRFSNLKKYMKEEFFFANLEFIFETKSTLDTYRIFSVHFVPKTYNYSDTTFNDSVDFLGYIEMFHTSSLFDEYVELNAHDIILTLATQFTQMEEGYLLIHAKRISSVSTTK